MTASLESMEVDWLGSVRYADALELQSQAVADRIAGDRGDRILLVEHPAVITLGRSSDPANMRVTPDELLAAGIDVYEIARGGSDIRSSISMLSGGATSTRICGVSKQA